MSLVEPQPLMGWSGSPPYPKSPPNSTLESLKGMGGTSKGLPFTFETSLEKSFHPPINRGPLYTNKNKQVEYFYVIKFVFDKPTISQKSLNIHSKCCTSLLLIISTINSSPLYFHFQQISTSSVVSVHVIPLCFHDTSMGHAFLVCTKE